MNRTIPLSGFGLFCLLLLVSFQSVGQVVSGIVFRDFNSNGQQEIASLSGTYGEPGIVGVVVTAVNAANTPVASATTSASGAYTLTTGSGQFRLSFSNFLPGDFVSFRGTQNRTDVRFVAGGTTNVDLALNYPAHFCGDSNPALLVPCYINGDPMSSTATTPAQAAGLRDVLVSLPYSASGLTPPETMVAKGQEIGAVYGLAVHRAGNNIFSAP
ncbi:MAG: hypothetical protein LH609_13820 [Rudanella sp.]|nr:hypothetical protein [Rudanella sp.]